MATLLSPGTYALLSVNLLSVLETRTFTVATNVKDGRYRPVVITAKPAFNAATQKVIQNGWTINPTNVNPVWQIVALSATEISDLEWRASQIAIRAVAAVATDEINLLRAWVAAYKVEVAASTTLADLKTRVAALPNMPARTLTQVRSAVAAKIDAGTVD